jgi:uncharacterized cupredoxin-like copper-binding protein
MGSQTNNVVAGRPAHPVLCRRQRPAAIAAAVVLLAVSLGACVGESPEDAAPAATVRMGEYFFAPGELTVPRNANVLLQNEGALVHSWVIQGAGIGTAGIAPGRSFILTLKDLRPGRYIVYCDQAGHTQAGQSGVLIIA